MWLCNLLVWLISQVLLIDSSPEQIFHRKGLDSNLRIGPSLEMIAWSVKIFQIVLSERCPPMADNRNRGAKEKRRISGPGTVKNPPMARLPSTLNHILGTKARSQTSFRLCRGSIADLHFSTTLSPKPIVDDKAGQCDRLQSAQERL